MHKGLYMYGYRESLINSPLINTANITETFSQVIGRAA